MSPYQLLTCCELDENCYCLARLGELLCNSIITGVLPLFPFMFSSSVGVPHDFNQIMDVGKAKHCLKPVSKFPNYTHEELNILEKKPFNNI